MPIDTLLYQIDTHFLKERRGTFACTYSLYTQFILFYTSLIHFYTTLIHFFKKKRRGTYGCICSLYTHLIHFYTTLIYFLKKGEGILCMHMQSLYSVDTLLYHIDTLKFNIRYPLTSVFYHY